jgi:hypothetical protein
MKVSLNFLDIKTHIQILNPLTMLSNRPKLNIDENLYSAEVTMFCPNCGHPNEADNQSCKNCGQPLMTQSVAHRKLSVSQKMGVDKKHIVAVIVLVAMVVIAATAVASLAFANNSNRDNGFVSGSVTINPSYARPVSHNALLSSPSSADEVVMLSFTINNGMSYLTYTDPTSYKLTCANGLSYNFTSLSYHSPGAFVYSGKLSTVYVPFEIPTGTTPTSLAFDDGEGNTCRANFAGVWSTDPITPPN